MPELPEVETTVRGLKRVLIGKIITDFWSDLPQKSHVRTETIKYRPYFMRFTKAIVGARILDVERRAKNILIRLSGGLTIIIHMKMTGHLLYGTYEKAKAGWRPKDDGPLKDPFNRFVHAVFSLSDGTPTPDGRTSHLAFSDARKFGTIALYEENSSHHKTIAKLGPEPFDETFTLQTFIARISKKYAKKIKTVLMDQEVIAGIGNIYSDEILWKAGVHPERPAGNITLAEFKRMYEAMHEILTKGIDFGGDSTSDYRNIDGLPGEFHYHHQAYRNTGKPCGKKGCRGVILRKMIGGRSAHFCSEHQV